MERPRVATVRAACDRVDEEEGRSGGWLGGRRVLPVLADEAATAADMTEGG